MLYNTNDKSKNNSFFKETENNSLFPDISSYKLIVSGMSLSELIMVSGKGKLSLKPNLYYVPINNDLYEGEEFKVPEYVVYWNGKKEKRILYKSVYSESTMTDNLEAISKEQEKREKIPDIFEVCFNLIPDELPEPLSDVWKSYIEKHCMLYEFEEDDEGNVLRSEPYEYKRDIFEYYASQPAKLEDFKIITKEEYEDYCYLKEKRDNDKRQIFNSKQKREIKKAVDSGESFRSIATRYNSSPGTISNLKKRGYK